MSHSANASQLDLLMDTPELDPSSDAALRAAFATLRCADTMTFEHAMANSALAIGIRNCAEELVRRIQHKRELRWRQVVRDGLTYIEPSPAQ